MFTKSDQISEKEKKMAVALHRFYLLAKGKRKNDIFCFYEGGPDPDYYSFRVESIRHLETHSIICGSKENVINIFNTIYLKSEYRKYLKAFFVDRDYDKSIIKKYNFKIYETPCYSIENFYTSRKSFKKILNNFFKLSDEDSEFKKCINYFLERQKEFHKSVLLLNAWIFLMKDAYKNKKYKNKLNLGDKLPTGIVNFTDNKISKNYTKTDLEKHFNTNYKYLLKDIKNRQNILKKKNAEYVFRGKYEFQFLVQILKYLINDANNVNILLKNKVKFNIDESHKYSVLSGCAETPTCLIRYIELI